MYKWIVVALVVSPLVYSAPIPRKAAAPAPAKKQAIPSEVEGFWNMTWGGGSEWKVYFGQNGSYSCNHAVDGEPWAGTYDWNAKERILHVTESRIGSDSSISWTVTLDHNYKSDPGKGGPTVHLHKPVN